MVKVEKLSDNRVKLTIKVSAEQFDEALEKSFLKNVEKVELKGFRKGKVPKNIFIQHYGWESLYEDAVEFALDATYGKAVEKSGVEPVDYPKIDLDPKTKIEKGQGFTYFAEIDVMPEIHLGEYKGLDVKKQAVRVNKKDVDEYVNNALKAKAENVVKETAAENGDTCVIDFEGFIDGVAFEGGKGENYPLELGSNSFIPGFEEQLVGALPEESREVKVTFPENYHEGLSGKEAIFKCTVHEIKFKQVPELNDEFVAEQEIENVKTVDEYLEHVKATIKTNKTNEANTKFENDCVDAVCKNSYAEFPISLINRLVENRYNSVEQQAKQYGVEASVLLGYYGFGTVEDFKKMTEEQVRKEYLEMLIFDEIAKLENLEATKEEIAAKYKEAATQSGQKVADIKKQYPSKQLAEMIKREKAVEFIKANVSK